MLLPEWKSILKRAWSVKFLTMAAKPLMSEDESRWMFNET